MRDKDSISINDTVNRLLKNASAEPDPNAAIARLLEEAIEFTDSTAGYLYKLDLAKSTYRCVYPANVKSDISVELLNGTIKPTTRLEQVILHKKQTIVTPQDETWNSAAGQPSQIMIPLLRGSECLGALDIRAQPPVHFSHQLQTFFSTIGSACLLLFEKERTLALLTAIQQPIDYHQAFRDFLNALLILISDASGMPFIVIREYDSKADRLECLAQFGFNESPSLERLNIDSVAGIESFRLPVISGKSFLMPDKNDDKQMRQWKEIDGVKSYVVTPVKVGSKIFGTLSFGASCRYNYTQLEVVGFESIANSIGVSITNYRNFHNRQADIIEKIKKNTSITAADVAQTARHEAREHLDMAQTLLLLMQTYVKTSSRENINKIAKAISQLTETLQDIGLSLNKIRDITKPPEQTMRRCKLNEIWDDAFRIVQWRLDSEHIDYRVSECVVEADVFPDYLLHAFLNLIINSIDAFREYGKKSNRSIVVDIQIPSEAANTIQMKYTDNASGIDPSKLKSSDARRKHTVEDIFEPGVTSKEGGSGYGLYLVRNIMQEHNGSIDLTSHRNGAQFVLILPKAIFKKNK